MPLKQVVMMAYDLRDFSYSGPDWMEGARFDIVAKPPSPVNRDEMKVLIRSLLAERFKLVIRRETKVLPVYELMVAKGGLKITAVPPGPSSTNSNTNSGKSTLTAPKMTMASLADWLSGRLDRPVGDKTETSGAFDVKLEWSRDDSPSADPDAGPSIFTALQEQLGLRLAAGQKAPGGSGCGGACGEGPDGELNLARGHLTSINRMDRMVVFHPRKKGGGTTA
jgi:uncharacterized protein (TIGR03435 family)